jgi:3-methylcrotonyl-CoA carboxylase alpha subunit
MAAVRAAQAVGYVNAGTVEFIASQDGQFYFLEMNTRLQVEHPVTESVTGLDLVELQFLIAGGLPIPFEQSDVTQRGHAIECRVYAEDAQRSFLPSIGTLHTLDMPAGPGIRIDSGVRAGDAVTIHYDPMIAKIIAYAPTRDGARRKLLHALRQMVVLGVTTNVRFLIRLLDDPVFAAGKIDTTYVDANLGDLIDDPESGVDAAVLIALALSEAGASAPVDAAASQRDPYSPWARPDGFRLHD